LVGREVEPEGQARVLHLSLAAMDIHFVSTLTPDDEDRYAPLILNTVRAILETLPVAYTVRIATTGALVLQHSVTEPAAGQRNTPAAPAA
jgi:hypothetical protein